MITITCDTCKMVLDDEYITIGSENGSSLKYINDTDDQNLKILGNYRDIHFCSKEHFIEYFFGKTKSEDDQ